jgi:hypothetical protein
MWPYWLLFLVPAFWAVTSLNQTVPATIRARQDHWPAQWRGVFVLLVLMIGWRHEVGGDWETYLMELDLIFNESTETRANPQDPMFAVLNWVAVNSGLGVYFVNILSAIIFSWGLLVFCRAQTRPWLALTVAVPYLITVVAMGYTRQGVAIGVAMLGMVALGRGNILRFMLWIGLAATFHRSAVILAPLALLAGSKRNAFALLWVAVTCITLFALMLWESLDSFVNGYLRDEMQSSGAAIRIAMNAFPAVLFLLFRKRFQLSAELRSFWTWMALSALLFVALLFVSPSSTAVDRVALYWIPLQIFVFSRLPNALDKRNSKNAVWVYAVVTYSAGIQFVWLIYADTAFAWLPYQFYPWVWLWR